MGKGPSGYQAPSPAIAQLHPVLPSPGRYLAEGAMELPPAHDELGLLLANALQAAQVPG